MSLVIFSILAALLCSSAEAATSISGWSNLDQLHRSWNSVGQLMVDPGHHHHHLNSHLNAEGSPIVSLGGGEHNQFGSAWSRVPNSLSSWQADMTFSIAGDAHSGGNGLAFWYVQNPSTARGNAMGASELWNGLGVVLDTYDDDNRGNNPAIMGIMNDGTQQYQAHKDGEGQYFAGCLRELRNQEHPVALRVTYQTKGGKLKVELADMPPQQSHDPHWATCFDHTGIKLPTNYYFGVSASTNDIPDTFQIHDMKIVALPEPSAAASARSVPQAHAHHEEQLRHLSAIKGHVGTIHNGLQALSDKVHDSHSQNELMVNDIRSNIQELRSDFKLQMAEIKTQLNTPHPIGGMHAAEPASGPVIGGLQSGSNIKMYLVVLASQTVIMGLFLMAKHRMDKAAERNRKFI